MNRLAIQEGEAVAPTTRASISNDAELIRYINLKLAALGQPTSQSTADPDFLEIAGPLLRNYHQKNQLLRGRLCPADARIQAFLDDYLAGVPPSGAGCPPRLPSRTFVLDRPGLARVMSLPPSSDTLTSPYVRSYRIRQGILHNPKSDRRTTQRNFSHRRRRPADSGRQNRRAEDRVFAALLARALTSARGCPGVAVHGGSGRTRCACSSPCSCGRWSVPLREPSPQDPWRSGSSRPPVW